MRAKFLRFVRRVIGTEQLLEKQKRILFAAEATYHATKFSQTIKDCPWLKYKGFSFGDSVGDFYWAMDALALHNIFRILEDAKPKIILEFGLGQSSKMVHQYAEYYKANALTIEHDQDWINYIKNHASQINFNVCQADLESVEINGTKTTSYKNIVNICSSALSKTGGHFIVLDGFSGQHYSRPPILDFVRELGEDFCIFMHDSERVGEQETLSLLYKKLNQNGTEFLQRNYNSTKQHTIVCSKSWKFLISI